MLEMIPVFMFICFIICLNDLERREIPDFLILCGVIAALLMHATVGFESFRMAGAGLFAGGFSMLLAGCLAIKIFGSEGIGGGDVKLMAMIGAFFGPVIALQTFAFYPVLASLWAATFLKTSLPLSPFIVFASFIFLLMKGNYGT